MTKEDWLRQRQDFDRTLYTVRQLRKPIFAAVNGIAYGGGCELAQSTDFIIASDNATFGQPEAMIGLAAGGGSPVFLPRLLPPGRALQMLMTGQPISAQEAHRLGMVNELHPPAELMDAARGIADTIASNSPTAVQAVKRAVRLGDGQPIEQAIATMMEAHWRSAVHPDRSEGIRAFNEGRDPTSWTPTTDRPRAADHPRRRPNVTAATSTRRAQPDHDPPGCRTMPRRRRRRCRPRSPRPICTTCAATSRFRTMTARCMIGGAVEQPDELTLDDLRALPAVDTR